MTTKLVGSPGGRSTSISEAFRDPAICFIPRANMPLANGLKTSNLSVYITVNPWYIWLACHTGYDRNVGQLLPLPQAEYWMDLILRIRWARSNVINLILRKDCQTACNCLLSSFPFSSTCKSGDLSPERQILVRSRMGMMKFFKAPTNGQEYVTNVTDRRALRMEIKHRKRYFSSNSWRWRAHSSDVR